MRLAECNGETVTLIRGSQQTTATASPVLLRAEELDEGVAVTAVEFQSFGIDAADYQFGGTPTTPQTGDVIQRADGSRYRVTSFNEAPPFRYTTSNRDRFLVFTDRIA